MIDITKLRSDSAKVERFESGDIIISDGDIKCDKMYILVNGMADVYKNYGQPGEVKVATLGRGDFFGEMSLFLRRERTATVVASSSVEIEALAIDRENALKFIREYPEAAYSIIEVLCSRLLDTNEKIADSSTKYVKDVSSLSAEKEKFKTAANTDALTGIFNRRYFMETAVGMIERTAVRGKKIYVALIDLDFFKRINDTYGHQAGDKTLKTSARVISETLRGDDLFARYGGEEFIALLMDVTDETVMNLAERVRRNIEDAVIEFEDLKIKVTASFGITEVAAPNNLNAAIARADEALYMAKESGRNKAVLI